MTPSRRQNARYRDLPPSLEGLALARFRAGYDTLDIARQFGVHESVVLRALDRARVSERGAA